MSKRQSKPMGACVEVLRLSRQGLAMQHAVSHMRMRCISLHVRSVFRGFLRRGRSVQQFGRWCCATCVAQRERALNPEYMIAILVEPN